MTVDAITEGVAEVLRRSERLARDFREDLRGGDRAALAGLLKRNPLKYLSEGADSKFFGMEGEEFFTRLAWPAAFGEEERVAFAEPAEEIVEWRVEEYLRGGALTPEGAAGSRRTPS